MAKKATAKSNASKKKTVSSRKGTSNKHVSFKVSSTTPFLVYRMTQQTVLWIILMVYILLLSVWVLKIQIDTLNVINSIGSI